MYNELFNDHLAKILSDFSYPLWDITLCLFIRKITFANCPANCSVDWQYIFTCEWKSRKRSIINHTRSFSCKILQDRSYKWALNYHICCFHFSAFVVIPLFQYCHKIVTSGMYNFSYICHGKFSDFSRGINLSRILSAIFMSSNRLQFHNEMKNERLYVEKLYLEYVFVGI